jgi:hypothetical protein
MATNLIIISGARFTGDFLLGESASGASTADEKALVAALGSVMDDLAADEVLAAQITGRDAYVQASRERRTKTAGELRDAIDKVCSGKLATTDASSTLYQIRGKYVAAMERLNQALFVVTEHRNDTTKLVDDLNILVTEGLPPPNDIPSPEKQALYVALDAAGTVIKCVAKRIDGKGNKSAPSSQFAQCGQPLVGAKYIDGQENTSSPNGRFTQGDQLLDVYIRRLGGIGRLGLQGPFTPLANLALAGLKAEFVAQQAGRIKNAYIRSLGKACGIASVLCLLLYAAIENEFVFTGEFWTQHKMFLVAAAGASIGTWLSFSIRRVTLTFEDLGILEEDLLDPSVRVIFVIALTMTACLLFWTKAMNIEIGNLKTSGLNIDGEIAMLVGIFCGIAERALATAISGRAAAFVKGIAGGG